MIDWSDEAIEAAVDTFYEGSDMRAALDAAVKAMDLPNTTMLALKAGRDEALEECEALVVRETKNCMPDLCAAIRALKGDSIWKMRTP